MQGIGLEYGVEQNKYVSRYTIDKCLVDWYE